MMGRVPPPPVRVGAWVRQEMETRKISVQHAADRSGLSRQTWYALLADKHPPSIDTQRGVAEALEVEPAWYDRLKAGEEPQPAELAAPDMATRLETLEGEVAALRRQVALLLGAAERLLTDEPVAIVAGREGGERGQSPR